MRGEYSAVWVISGWSAELPPRARRIHNIFLRGECYPGTTSACAENTYWDKFCIMASLNYLRVRGEYECADCFESFA